MPAPCCDLGRADDDRDTPLPPTPRRFRDALGFTYRLCEVHYRVLTRVLLAHEAVGARAGYVPAPEAAPRPGQRPTRAARRVAPAVSGADQARARRVAGLSQRQLAVRLARSRSQLAEAEAGRRPVDPVAAAWVATIIAPVANR